MDPRDRERYSRQILFPAIGEQGQERLLRAHAAIAGCGALGSFHAAALARAGVGRITIIDRDYVEPSNLQRQWLFDESDAAESLPKAAAAARALARINSGIEVRPVVADLTPENIGDLLAGADVILDGTDNFDTRFLLNDYAVSRGVPWIYGAAVGSYGLTMPVIPGRTACFRCVYPEPPGGVQPTCETAGILNPTIAMVAALQVAAALKILCGKSDLVSRPHHHHRRLGWRHPRSKPAPARPRLPRLRPPRISIPRRTPPPARRPMRPQRRPGPRARTPPRPARAPIPPRPPRRSPRQPLRPAFLHPALRNHRLPRRPRHHQRHRRPRPRPQPLRPLHRNLSGHNFQVVPWLRSSHVPACYLFSGSSTHGGVASITRPSSGSTCSILHFMSHATCR